uniref:Uncharacterized protein n=1 Tax=Romanomermis culicivorax TaxID=13658 RepID=A0A915HIH4_ROMCU
MALQKISETESDRTAEDLLNGICTFESIIGLTTVTAAAEILEHLATLLQQKNIDLIAAYQEIQITKEALENFLVNEAKFNILYEEAVKIGHDIGATESLPLAEQRKHIVCQVTGNLSPGEYLISKKYLKYYSHPAYNSYRKATTEYFNIKDAEFYSNLYANSEDNCTSYQLLEIHGGRPKIQCNSEISYSQIELFAKDDEKQKLGQYYAIKLIGALKDHYKDLGMFRWHQLLNANY